MVKRLTNLKSKYVDRIQKDIKKRSYNEDFKMMVGYYPQIINGNRIIHSREVENPKLYYKFTYDGFLKFNEYQFRNEQLIAQHGKKSIKKSDKDKYLAQEIIKLFKKQTGPVDEENDKVSLDDVINILTYNDRKFVFDHNPPKDFIVDQLQQLDKNDHNLTSLVKNILDNDYEVIVISTDQDQALRNANLSSCGTSDKRLQCLNELLNLPSHSAGRGGELREYSYWENFSNQKQEINVSGVAFISE